MRCSRWHSGTALLTSASAHVAGLALGTKGLFRSKLIDTNDVGHLLEALDVFFETRGEVPDANRATGSAMARA
jgi:hypothetical protein